MGDALAQGRSVEKFSGMGAKKPKKSKKSPKIPKTLRVSKILPFFLDFQGGRGPAFHASA